MSQDKEVVPQETEMSFQEKLKADMSNRELTELRYGDVLKAFMTSDVESLSNESVLGNNSCKKVLSMIDELNLEHNRLTSLPDTFNEAFPNLTKLNIQGNKFENLEKDILSKLVTGETD